MLLHVPAGLVALTKSDLIDAETLELVRLEIRELTAGSFLEGAPIFAVEVRSEEDYGPRAERRLAEKRRDYFAAGTFCVWDVDLLGSDVIKAYHADDPEKPLIFRRGELANAGEAVPAGQCQLTSCLLK